MKARDILNPQKKKAKHLWSGKSFDDLKLAASPEMSSDGKYNSPLLTPRSLSFGASSTRAVSQRIACLSVTHPHTPDAYELINKCGHGATAEVCQQPFLLHAWPKLGQGWVLFLHPNVSALCNCSETLL